MQLKRDLAGPTRQPEGSVKPERGVDHHRARAARRGRNNKRVLFLQCRRRPQFIEVGTQNRKPRMPAKQEFITAVAIQIGGVHRRDAVARQLPARGVPALQIEDDDAVLLLEIIEAHAQRALPCPEKVREAHATAPGEF